MRRELQLLVVAVAALVGAHGRVVPSPNFARGLLEAQSSEDAPARAVVASVSSPLAGGAAAVRAEDVLVLDCAAAAPGDLPVAVAVSSALVCEIPYSDLVRGPLRLPTLQAALEYTAARRGGVKELAILCTGVPAGGVGEGSDLSDLVQGRIQTLWEDAVKPRGVPPPALEDIVKVTVATVPHGGTGAARKALVGRLESTLPKIDPSSLRDIVEVASAGVARPLASAVPVVPVAEAAAEAACGSAMAAVEKDFATMLSSGDLASAGLEEFGAQCSEALEDALSQYDALAIEFEATGAFGDRRRILSRRLTAQMEPLFRIKAQALAEQCWDRLRQSLSKLRLGDVTLGKEMAAGIHDADKHFRQVASTMSCAGASPAWSAEADRRLMVDKMNDFMRERLQSARLQGTYVPGMLRRPVAVSIHWLSQRPFNILDALQDTVTYEEDMEFDPEFEERRAGKNPGRIQTLGEVPREVAAFAEGSAMGAERRR